MSWLWIRILLGCSLYVLACASRGKQRSDGGGEDVGSRELDDEGAPLLQAELRATRLGYPCTLPQKGGVLFSGDSVWFELTLTDPSYLYVLQVSATGETTVLYPKGSDRRFEGAVRIPTTGRFRLDEHVGTEHAVLVATKRPIGEVKSAAALAEYFRRALTPEQTATAGGRSVEIDPGYPARKQMQRHPGSAKKKRVVRAMKTDRYEYDEASRSGDARGLIEEVEYEGSEFVIYGDLDHDGVLVIPVTFTHAKRP